MQPAAPPVHAIGQQNTSEAFDRYQGCCSNSLDMTKILSLVIMGLMIVQIIKPLGLPGLRRRSDFWKLAVVALAMVALTAGLSHG